MKRTREANDTLLSPVDGCLYRLFIEQDEYAGNPRQEFDNAGTLISWSGDYCSPDKNEGWPTSSGWRGRLEGIPVTRPVRVTQTMLADDELGDWWEIVESLQNHYDGYIILPLSHDRDGLEENDARVNGYAFMSRETILKEWGKKGAKLITPAMREKALACLRSEIAEYNQWANGEVHAYYIDRLLPDEDGDFDDEQDAEELDSCCGFYGYEYAREEGLLMLRAAATGTDAEHHARTLAGLKELAQF